MAKAESEVKISLGILMGLPGSGKTTFAQRLVKECKDKPLSIQVISYDDFVPHRIQAHCASLSEQNLTKHFRRKFVRCIQSVVEYFVKNNDNDAITTDYKSISSEFETLSLSSEGEDLIPNNVFLSKIENCIKSIDLQNCNRLVLLIDDNNYYTSMRNDFYQIAKEKRLGFCTIYCKSSVKSCRQRNSERESQYQVPDKTIIEMSLKLEEPNPMVNICDSFCVQISENHENIPLVIDVLENSISNPIDWTPPVDRTHEIERERRICSQNEIHQADLILRKWINKELSLSSFFNKPIASSAAADSSSNVLKKDKREFSKDLNKRKTIVLDKLRSGEFKMTAEIHQDLEFRNEVIQLAQSVLI